MNEGELRLSKADLIRWTRAGRPVSLAEWMGLSDWEQTQFIEAEEEVFCLRATLAASIFASMQADPGEALAPIDGGQTRERQALFEAMAKAAQGQLA